MSFHVSQRGATQAREQGLIVCRPQGKSEQAPAENAKYANLI